MRRHTTARHPKLRNPLFEAFLPAAQLSVQHISLSLPPILTLPLFLNLSPISSSPLPPRPSFAFFFFLKTLKQFLHLIVIYGFIFFYFGVFISRVYCVPEQLSAVLLTSETSHAFFLLISVITDNFCIWDVLSYPATADTFCQSFFCTA